MNKYIEASETLKTISGITITPFDKNREIIWDGVTENVNYLIEKGLKVIVPCGNTSEFYSLTISEAKEEIKHTVDVADKKAFVLAGVGYDVKTAIEMGNYAKDVGADGIMIHMPVHPYITSGGAKEYFENIINNVDLPAVIYFKDPHISDDIIFDLAKNERFVGVKYAVNDLPRFTRVAVNLPKNDNVTLICGTAEKWAPYYFSAGAEGFTSGLVNVYPEKAFELLHSLQSKDFKKSFEIWNNIVKFEDLRAKYNNGNNVVIIKEAMEMLNLTAGITREPVSSLNDTDRTETEELLKFWGFDIKKKRS